MAGKYDLDEEDCRETADQPNTQGGAMESHSRYGTALALLLVAYVLDAFEGPLIQLVVGITYVLLLSLLILDPKEPRWAKILSLALVASSLVATTLFSSWESAPATLGPVSMLLSAVVIGTAIAVVLRRVAGHERVDLSTVLGAVLAYSLLGFFFSAIYQAIDMTTSEAFFAQGDVLDADYLYFSFVTLTTLGFGDLSPAIEIGKRLVVLEALAGEVFLVVLVARMVSLWQSPGSLLRTIRNDQDQSSLK